MKPRTKAELGAACNLYCTLINSPSGISWDFLFFLPKMTGSPAAFEIVYILFYHISYCFAVKIYHEQHPSNIVITFDFETYPD